MSEKLFKDIISTLSPELQWQRSSWQLFEIKVTKQHLTHMGKGKFKNQSSTKQLLEEKRNRSSASNVIYPQERQ